MKASEMITDLASLIAEHGDLDVHIVVGTKGFLEHEGKSNSLSVYKRIEQRIEIYGEE